MLCFRGKEVLKMSEFDKVIESEFLHCKGVGSRKLKQQLATRYQGVSEPRVRKILSKSSHNQMVNAKFGNKAISRPIRASGVQVSILPLSYHGISNESPCIFSSSLTWPRNKTYFLSFVSRKTAQFRVPDRKNTR